MTPTSDNAVRAQPALLVAMVLAALDQWATFARTGCKLPRRELQAYSKEGDIMFGALAPVNIETLPAAFSFTQPPAPRNCNRTYPEMYQCVLAMAFATEEINQNPQILPNLTLGFRIVDSCYTESGALQSILWLLAGQNNTLPNYRCQPNIKAPAIIGDVFSSASVEMARTLGCLNIPQVERKRSFCPLVFIPDSNSISTKKINQGDLAECAKKIGLLQVTVNSLKGFPKIYEGMISYGSGLPLLSDKIQFPSFVRTCPSTGEVPYILVQIVIHFGWTWVGILGSNSEYGLYGIMELKKEFSLSHVCVAFLDTLRSDSTRARILATVQTIKESTATVIILYAFAPEVIPIIEELVAQEVTGNIWIISPSLIGSPLFSRQDLWKLLNGTIGVGNHAVGLPLFKVFQHQNRPTTSYGDIFIRPFWEHVFHCRWEDGRTPVNATYNRTVGGINVCTGQEQLETLPSSLYDANNLRFSYKAYNAVYTFAHAMHNLLSCDHAKSRCSGSMEDIQPWQLLHVVRNIHFKNPMGEDVYFNEHGDPPHVGDILNWQLSQDGTSRYVYVGIYDSQLPQDQRVRIYADRILWGKGHIEVPQSVCSKACPLGFREAAQEGKPVCCFDCVLCPEGEIANTTGMKNCLKCSQDHWSDPQRIECHKKRLEFLKFQETLGTVLSVASIVLTLTTAWVLSVFIRHSETPIVRANNRTLSYLILFSLILCFLCPLLFIGRPERWSCILRQMVFGVVFSLCESCILAKTMIVVLAFKARVPNSRYRSWLAVKIPFSIVLICLFTQFLLCITWLGLSPPFLEFNMKDSVDKIFLQCNENSETAFYSMLGFLSLLACLSFVVAFKARKLPDRFNETKWITFSMMVFLSVWASFLPAYLSTKGKYMVAVEIFAILSSSAGVLVCIFFPKCYTVLLKPEMNTRKKQ